MTLVLSWALRNVTMSDHHKSTCTTLYFAQELLIWASSDLTHRCMDVDHL